jgi:hypothetical protein
MAQPPSAHSGGAAPLSLAQRFIGMLTSPKATFESVVSFPRWLGMMVVTGLILTLTGAIFAYTSVGQDILVGQYVEGGMPQAQAETFAKYAPIITLVAAPFFVVLFTLIQAGILMGVFAITGGSASFKQVLAVIVHAGVIGAVIEPLNQVVNYVRHSAVKITSLAGIGNAFAEKSFPAFFFSALDLAIFLGIFVLAMGLGVLYRRRTAPIFAGLAGLYVVIAIVIGVVRASMAGGS